MTTNEIAFLILVVAAMSAFGLTLFFVSSTEKRR